MTPVTKPNKATVSLKKYLNLATNLLININGELIAGVISARYANDRPLPATHADRAGAGTAAGAAMAVWPYLLH